MKPNSVIELGTKLIRAREPMLVTGEPGSGKTDCITEAAARAKTRLFVCHPVTDDPTDYKGMPAVVKVNGQQQAKFLPFGNLQELITVTEPVTVLFDDLGHASLSVQAAVMQLILSRSINGHRISNLVTFVAATNRRQDKAGVTGLISPLLDRFIVVVNMEVDAEDWRAWALQHDMPVPLIAFASFRPQLFGKFEPSRDLTKSPTLRSIAGLGRLINLEIDDQEAVYGAVGEAFGAEFLAFYKTYLGLPNREEIYLNPDQAPVPDRPDILYALMGALSFNAKEGNLEATVQYLSRVPPEYSVLCMKDISARHRALTNTRAFTKWAELQGHKVLQ